MKRKLIKQGVGGFTVYLPSKWIKSNSLDKGDEVDVSILNNQLIVSTDKQEQKKETSVCIEESVESSIRTVLTNAYRLGYNKVTLRYKKPEIFKYVPPALKQLLGFEIISVDENKCVIESVTEPDDAQHENISLKFFYSISEHLENIQKMLDGIDVSAFVDELQDRIKKYDNLCRRMILKNAGQESPTALLWTFYTNLMHAQRELYLLSKYLRNNKRINISPETKKLFKELIKIFDTLKTGYLKKDLSLLEKIHDMEKKLVYNTAYKLMETKKGKEQVLIHRMTSAIRGFYLCSSPLMGVSLLNS